MAPDADRVGVLIVRIWTEGSGHSLRARITETRDVSIRGETSHLVAGTDEVLSTVRNWIEAFLAEER